MKESKTSGTDAERDTLTDANHESGHWGLGRFATESDVIQRCVHFTSSTREKVGTDLVPPKSHDLLTFDQSGTRLTKGHNNPLRHDYDRRKSTIYRYSLKGLEREL